MYVFGGYAPQPVAGIYLNEILILDLSRKGERQFVDFIYLETFVWEKLEPKGNPPMARDAICIQEYDAEIYVFGGRGKDGSFNDLFVYDTSKDIMEMRS